MMILLISKVYALGVSPGRRTIDFEPELSKEITIKVVNTQHKKFKAEIYTKGDLGQYIKLEKNKIEFKENELEKEVKYTINLPKKLKYGLNKGEIIIREIPEQKAGKIKIGTLVAVASQIHVNVPYPGKFLKAGMKIVANNLGDDVLFYIPIHNLGSEDINNVVADITIFDPESNEIAKVSSDSKSLKSKQRTELTTMIKNFNFGYGVYNAKAIVNYDGITTKVNKMFIITGFWLIPLDVSVDNFKLGEINKINILVENIGNIKIKNAFSRLVLNDEFNDNIADIKSISTDIAAKSKKEMEAYWDTKDIDEGSYDGKLVLSYEDKSSEKPVVTEITQDEMKVDIIGATGYVVRDTKKGPDGFSKFKIIIFLLVLFDIILILYLFVFRKKRRT
jgi:hypothetical protein